MVLIAVDVLDDERSVGEDFLFPVDWQQSVLAFPDNRFDWVSGNGACDDESFSRDDRFLLHWSNVGQSMNVELGGVVNNSDLRSRDTLVETTVLGLSRCDVQVRNDVAIDSDVLADLEAFRVDDFLAVEFPRNFRSWVAASNAFNEDWVAWMEDFFGESLTDDWWIDCRKKKQI